jgi:uncharacterized membrane protein YciS (DUF1049 family)
METEITILLIILITFIMGIVGGCIIAEIMHPEFKRDRLRAKRKARREKRRKNANFYH